MNIYKLDKKKNCWQDQKKASQFFQTQWLKIGARNFTVYILPSICFSRIGQSFCASGLKTQTLEVVARAEIVSLMVCAGPAMD